MNEVLRRAALALGMIVAASYFWYTPAQLIAVRVVDFENEYQALYGHTTRPPIGVTARARAFLRKQTDPGSARKHREAALGSRSIEVPPAFSAAFLSQIAAAQRAEGPLAGRSVRDFVYFDAEEPPFHAVAAALRRSRGDTGYLNAYATTGAVDLEFYFHPEPHSSIAPAAIQFPLRSIAWTFAAGGLLLYALLGIAGNAWRRGIGHDPLPLAVLDTVAALVAAFFVGLPLRIYPSTEAALDDLFGGTLYFWGIALIALISLIALAALAAFRVECGDDALRIRRLFGSTSIPWNQVADVLLCGLDGSQPGFEFRLFSGARVALPFTGLRDALSLLNVLRQHGWLRPEGSPRTDSPAGVLS